MSAPTTTASHRVPFLSGRDTAPAGWADPPTAARLMDHFWSVRADAAWARSWTQ